MSITTLLRVAENRGMIFRKLFYPTVKEKDSQANFAKISSKNSVR